MYDAILALQVLTLSAKALGAIFTALTAFFGALIGAIKLTRLFR